MEKINLIKKINANPKGEKIKEEKNPKKELIQKEKIEYAKLKNDSERIDFLAKQIGVL